MTQQRVKKENLSAQEEEHLINQSQDATTAIQKDILLVTVKRDKLPDIEEDHAQEVDRDLEAEEIEGREDLDQNPEIDLEKGQEIKEVEIKGKFILYNLNYIEIEKPESPTRLPPRKKNEI